MLNLFLEVSVSRQVALLYVLEFVVLVTRCHKFVNVFHPGTRQECFYARHVGYTTSQMLVANVSSITGKVIVDSNQERPLRWHCGTVHSLQLEGAVAERLEGGRQSQVAEVSDQC